MFVFFRLSSSRVLAVFTITNKPNYGSNVLSLLLAYSYFVRAMFGLMCACASSVCLRVCLVRVWDYMRHGIFVYVIVRTIDKLPHNGTTVSKF